MTGGAPVGTPRSSAKSSVEVVAQYLRATRMTQFRHGLGLDLADALPSNTVDLDLHPGTKAVVTVTGLPEGFDPDEITVRHFLDDVDR